MMTGRNVPLRGIADSTKRESAPPAKGLMGVFKESVQVGSHTVTVEGKVVNGVARIGTAYK